MSGLKIAVLGTRGFPNVQGGVEKHCEELYPRLVKLGYDITVFTRTPYISERERLDDWRGVKFIHLWCPRIKALEAITHTFLGVLMTKRLRPDILHIHSIGPSLVVPIAKKTGLKTIMTHHGPDYKRAKWGKFARTVLKYGEKLGVMQSDAVIAISKEIKQHIKERFDRDAFFIPNGVNIPSHVPAGEVLKKLGLKQKSYVFTACRFVPEKGLHDLIKAYRKIKNPQFQLVIAGDADHETQYSTELKKLASETEGVILTGFISGSPLEELYSNAGLFVLPSYYEGLPIALLEALSYGLPVLVSDIPQHKELLLKEHRYFPAGNIEILSNALSEMFSSGISEDEKEGYLKMIKEQYNWDKIALEVSNIYLKVLGLDN